MKDFVLSALGHTWILDIDGTIVKHNGYKEDGEASLLPGVEEFFRGLPPTDRVIFVTSRTVEYKEITERFLSCHEIPYDYIIYGAPYGERIVVNDNKPNGLEMAKKVCLKRNGGIDFSVEIDQKI